MGRGAELISQAASRAGLGEGREWPGDRTASESVIESSWGKLVIEGSTIGLELNTSICTVFLGQKTARHVFHIPFAALPTKWEDCLSVLATETYVKLHPQPTSSFPPHITPPPLSHTHNQK